MRIFPLFFLIFITKSAFTQNVSNQTNTAIENEILIELAPKATLQNILDHQPALANLIKIPTTKSISPNSNIYKLELTNSRSKKNILDLLAANPAVAHAQLNAEVEFRTTPDDPDFELQFGLDLIGATNVWDITTGGFTAEGDTIVVAVLDSGFDIQHEDLRRNIWSNQAEKLDGRDNDGNGYIDDINGWDYIDETGDIGISSHGTSVAGIVGSTGNNGIGVTGVNWNIKIIVMRTKQVDQIIAAYEYLIDQRRKYNESNGTEGAFIVATNASFGQSRTFCSKQPIWGGMYDKMGAVGILTGAATDNSNYDVEINGDMPTSCTSDFILTTTNVDKSDTKHQSAAFGEISIDMGAPGQGSYSIKPFDDYGGFDGNSAAAPHLTGSIALLYSLPCLELSRFAKENPREAALLIKDAILNGVEPNESLAEITATGGRLNVFNSMVELQNYCGATTGDLEIFTLEPNPTSDFITMTFETPDFENYTIDIYNTLGQQVYKEVIQPNRFREKQETIDVSILAKGTYFLTLRSGSDEIKTSKFVKI